jgi:aminopeptidase
MTEEELRAYAAVVLEVGLGFAPGKDLAINAMIEHAPFARLLCDEAYSRGAAYVDLWYWDPHTKSSRLRHAATDTLGRVPSWLDARYRDLGARQGALINLVGDPEPDLLRGIDPARAGLDRMPGLASRFAIQVDGSVEWTFACYPTAAWAQRVLGQPDTAALWEHLRRIMRLDTPDPIRAWHERMQTLQDRCAQLNERRFGALHLLGPGTDLLIGLPERHRWDTAALVSRAGINHVAALPTEEIFTTPDPARTEGTSRSTRPLALGGHLIEDLSLRFAGGRIVEVSATAGAEVVRGHIATDPGAARLGEVALVDRSSPIRQSGLTFYETLLDESAACHLAWGDGIPNGHLDYDPLRPETRQHLPINTSATHTDFMVGGPDLTVFGIATDNSRHRILEAEEWQL